MTGSSKFDYTDQEIIDEIEKTPAGEILSNTGPCSAIHACMERPGETYIFIGDDDALSVCYIDHDQCIEEMNFGRYGWHIHQDENGMALTLIIHDRDGDGQTSLLFSFKKRDRESVRQTKKIKSDKSLTVYFISILYGDLVKYCKQTFTIPESIAGKITA